MANRTLNTGNDLYTSLAFAFDGQSSTPMDLKSGASSWDTAPTQDGDHFDTPALTVYTLTLNHVISGALSFYLKYKYPTAPGNISETPYVIFDENDVARLQFGYNYATETEWLSRNNDYGTIRDYYGTAVSVGDVHELLVTLPEAVGPCLIVKDGSTVDTTATSNNIANETYTRFRIGSAGNNSMEIHTCCLWSGRALSWSDIASNVGTLFQAAGDGGGWLVITTYGA